MPNRAEALRLIREDAKGDATGLDGQAFSGLAVGTMFGNVLASIDALAAIVETLLPESEREEAKDAG